MNDEEFEITFDGQHKKLRLASRFPLDYSSEEEWKQFFASIFIFWNFELRGYHLPVDRLKEMKLWMGNKHRSLTVSSEVEFEYKRWAREMYKPETINFRGEIFDESLVTSGTQLYDYQLAGINSMISRNRTYLADDAGLGKTNMSILTFSHWFAHDQIDGVVILVRPGMSYHWKEEILDFSTFFQEKDIAIVDNVTKYRPFEKFNTAKIIIIPNHLLDYVVLSYRYSTKSDIPRKRKNLRWKTYTDFKQQWDRKSLCLISDEHHDFKNSSAVKVKALKAHIQSFDFRIFLSATPAINAFEDWYPQIAMLDRAILPMNEAAFKLSVADEIGDQWSPYAVQTYCTDQIDAVTNMFQPYILKRLKKNLPEMKAKQILIKKWFGLSQTQATLYAIIQAVELLIIKKKGEHLKFNNILHRFRYTLHVLDNPMLLNQVDFTSHPQIGKLLKTWKFGDDNRVKYLDNLVSNYVGNEGNKLVIYDVHPLTLDLLESRYKKYRPLKIHGQQNIKDIEAYRKDCEDQFNNNPGRKIILLSFATSSAGLNLQKGGHHIIFFTQPDDSVLFRQAMDRTHRIVSTKNTIVESLLYKHTFDIIRYRRNEHRVKFNDDFLTREMDLEEIEILMNGIVPVAKKMSLFV